MKLITNHLPLIVVSVLSAIVTFDPSRQNADSLSKVITSCGYRHKGMKFV